MTKRKSDVTILREYLKQRHTELYGIDYVTRNYAIEGRWLKTMITDYDADTVKRFIDACFDDYKPTREYPSLNFAFMYSYMRSRILPRVLADMKREHERKARVETSVNQTMSDDEFSDWI